MEIVLEYLKKILPVNSEVHVLEANNQALLQVEKFNIPVQISSKRKLVIFYVVDTPVTLIILGCDFYDDHKEAIRPCRRRVKLGDETNALIVRQPSAPSQFATFLLEELVYVPPCERTRTTICDFRETVVQHGPETSAEVTTVILAFKWAEPYQYMLRSHSCPPRCGVAKAASEKSFKIFAANFGDNLKICLNI